MDDCSKLDRTQDIIRYLEKRGSIYKAVCRPKKLGCHRYFDGMLELTESDPIVFTDDDILCPKLDPDWLSLGLKAMETHPKFGLIALNNPEANLARGRCLKQYVDEDVTLIQAVGGTFGFIRRSVLKDCAGEHLLAFKNIPAQSLCYRIWMHEKNWKIGYLTNVYCQHNQAVSVRARNFISNQYKLEPIDELTLEPKEELRG